jgi:protoheme IX farnesyltransferase
MTSLVVHKISLWFQLTQPKKTALLLLGGIAGGFLGYNGKNLIPIIIGIIALFLACSGVNTITNFIDIDIDVLMDRTKNRVLPSNRIPPKKALYFGVGLLVISIIILLPNYLFGIFWILFGFFFDAILYNYLTKRKTHWNILIGAPAGGAPVFVVWSVATKNLVAFAPLMLFGVVLLWTPVHVWTLALRYSEDYKKANVPMLPVVKEKKLTVYVIAIIALLQFVFSLLFYYLLYYPKFTIFMIFSIIGLAFSLYFASICINFNNKKTFTIFKSTSVYLAIVFISAVIYPFIK